MTRFTHSTNVRSGPEIDDRARPAPRVRAGGPTVAFGASAVVLATVTRPDPAGTDPGADAPEGRHS